MHWTLSFLWNRKIKYQHNDHHHWPTNHITYYHSFIKSDPIAKTQFLTEQLYVYVKLGKIILPHSNTVHNGYLILKEIKLSYHFVKVFFLLQDEQLFFLCSLIRFFLLLKKIYRNLVHKTQNTAIWSYLWIRR